MNGILSDIYVFNNVLDIVYYLSVPTFGFTVWRLENSDLFYRPMHVFGNRTNYFKVWCLTKG